MTADDKILFENYFYIYGLDRCSNIYQEYFDVILNCILNSKEIQDTALKLSNKVHKSTLLSLAVNVVNLKNALFRFSGLYYVTDGYIQENRTMYGTIEFKKNKIFLIMNIDRYGRERLSIQLSEMISVFNSKSLYEVFSSYSGMDVNSINYIKNKDFEKVDDFKKNTLRLIKSDVKR